MMPILYTFRRCPYAIRARMTLSYAGIKVDPHEVDLKNKPQELLQASAKGTVPVLVLENGQVIDQSIAIMHWALSQTDPDGWLVEGLQNQQDTLIQTNDFEFKPLLDQYKYTQPLEPGTNPYRDKATAFLNQLNALLINHRFLLADQITLADVAIFPFIRQFYKVDEQWFTERDHQSLQRWLHYFLNSELFLGIMYKVNKP